MMRRLREEDWEGLKVNSAIDFRGTRICYICEDYFANQLRSFNRHILRIRGQYYFAHRDCIARYQRGQMKLKRKSDHNFIDRLKCKLNDTK